MKHEVHNPDILTPEQNSVNGFTLGEGQQWRKTRVPWAWDDLPPTFRPFTTLDIITVGDQFQYHGMTGWLTIAEKDSDVGEEPYTSHKFRTRRPLPTPEIPWTEWHGGKCPLKDEEVEEWAYMARDGFTCSSPSAPSCYTPYWEHNAGADDIITYRVLKWKEKPYAAPPVKSPEIHELQERFAEPQLTYHQWRGEPRDQESPPTDNDSWECLLRTNANLGREVSELKKQRDALSSQLQGVIVACHLRGYHVGDSLGEWIEKQFEDAQARLAQLEWRPVSVKPTKEDADPFGNVQVCGITNGILQSHGLHSINYPFKDRNTHWRPAALPTIPDPSREEFERFFQERGDGYMPKTQDALFDLWKAARRTK